MGKRQREWALKAREALIDRLGGCCAWCGATSNLQIDHINGRTWKIRKVDPSWRVSIYRREAKSKALQVLCETCNLQKEKGQFPKEVDPF